MTALPTVVELDHGSLGPDVAIRRPRFPHRWVSYADTADDNIAARIDGATIVITNKIRLTRETLAAQRSIGLIAVAATGVDIVDLEAAREFGIDVVNVRRYAEDSVPEHTFALLLALARQLPAYRDAVVAGAWQRSKHFCLFGQPIRTLAGKTLGLVGFGSIARRVAAIAAAFDMKVVVSTPRPGPDGDVTFVDLDTLLSTADVVSLHCPLTEQTRGMINEASLATMRPTALLINTARGALVDESALAAALEAGKLGGAALDVLSVEPPTADNPLLRLADRPNVIITPHVAWGAREAVQRLADQLIDLIDAWQAGEPRHLVTAT